MSPWFVVLCAIMGAPPQPAPWLLGSAASTLLLASTAAPFPLTPSLVSPHAPRSTPSTPHPCRCDNITIAPPLLKQLESSTDPLPYQLWPQMVGSPFAGARLLALL